MADDRYEAYRDMYTRSIIRENLSGLNPFEQADYIYDCIQTALNSDSRWDTVSTVVGRVTTKNVKDETRQSTDI